MASLIYLDTHVIAWLYAGQTERIPAAARKAVNESELLISPMALVELQYLIACSWSARMWRRPTGQRNKGFVRR
jgi:hypothetical protein